MLFLGSAHAAPQPVHRIWAPQCPLTGLPSIALACFESRPLWAGPGEAALHLHPSSRQSALGCTSPGMRLRSPRRQWVWGIVVVLQHPQPLIVPFMWGGAWSLSLLALSGCHLGSSCHRWGFGSYWQVAGDIRVARCALRPGPYALLWHKAIRFEGGVESSPGAQSSAKALLHAAMVKSRPPNFGLCLVPFYFVQKPKNCFAPLVWDSVLTGKVCSLLVANLKKYMIKCICQGTRGLCKTSGICKCISVCRNRVDIGICWLIFKPNYTGGIICQMQAELFWSILLKL